MSKKPQAVDVGAAAQDWPAASPAGAQKDSVINRISRFVHKVFTGAVSNLRLSLTLRIALHFAWQLLCTTIPVLLCAMVVLCIAQAPAARTALDTLATLAPAEDTVYSATQLQGLPFTEAWLLDEPLPEGLAGIGERVALLVSRFDGRPVHSVVLYVDTVRGGVAAVYPVAQFVSTMQMLFWTLLCADLFRVLHFLRHRNRLNRRVLKPITDMAQTAAALSANNLSDRISVDGAKNELRDLALVINDMLDRIELSYNSQKQFVSDASHELRTPIAVIQGYVSMLERWGKTDKEVLDEGIAAIAQEAAAMKELVERLLFLARHDKKTLMLEMEVFDPLEVMSEIHREAKMLSTQHHFELSPAHNASINGDKDMIKQLMRILLDNAIKYTPEGGSITLGCRRDGKNVVLTVTDTGAGIAAEELPKVFDRFYRCDEARKAQSSGHGLGLSIARIIVVAHGGKLKVRSKVGAGTTFSVILPQEEQLER